MKKKENSPFFQYLCWRKLWRSHVSFYNNESSKKDEDLDCPETIAELTLRVLPHHDDSY